MENWYIREETRKIGFTVPDVETADEALQQATERCKHIEPLYGGPILQPKLTVFKRYATCMKKATLTT